MKGKVKRRKAHQIAELLLSFVLLPPATAWTQGKQISTPANGPKQILVSIPDRKLAVLEGGLVVRIFPVSIGAATSPSPVGTFQIVNLVVDPTYYHPGIVIPPGRDNPIGPRWIGLSRKGYGIHGTNEPKSVGRASSHGCIRLRNADIRQLFAMVHVGDMVEIRFERDRQTAEIFGGVALASNGNDPPGLGWAHRNDHEPHELEFAFR